MLKKKYSQLVQGDVKKADIKIYIGGTNEVILKNKKLDDFIKFGDKKHKKLGVIEAKAKKIFLHPDLGTSPVGKLSIIIIDLKV